MIHLKARILLWIRWQVPSTCWHQPVNEANRRCRSCDLYSVFDQEFSGGMKVVRTIANEHSRR